MSDLENALEPLPITEPDHSGYRPHHIVLLGAGEAHLHLLKHLAKHPLMGASITLIAAQAEQVLEASVPDFVAGRRALKDCQIALEPLVRKAGVRWLRRSVKALDAASRNLLLDDASTELYDLLSVDTGPLHNRLVSESQVPGSKKHALFALPSLSFAGLWPQVLKMGQDGGLRVAIIGQDARALAMAFAVRQSLPASSITLVAGTNALGLDMAPPARARLLRALKVRQITVLQDRATALDGSSVMLGCGAALACDIPIYAEEPQPAPWVQSSGLAVDADGFMALDSYGRSSSHSQVWATGNATGLFANLDAVLSGKPLKALAPPRRGLQLHPCGNRYAVGQWGPLNFEGLWVWWLQQHLTRRNMALYR